jgi:predicted secreted hydrolase
MGLVLAASGIGEKLMLYRLRQKDGKITFPATGSDRTAKSAQIASADIVMTPTASTEIEAARCRRMEHRHSVARAEDRTAPLNARAGWERAFPIGKARSAFAAATAA